MPKMRLVAAQVLLAASAAAAIDDLPPCQSRCYDMTAGLVGCDTDDYACHCSAWASRFAPQLSSCMIEGCAFGEEGPTMETSELQSKVCELAGQSPEGSSTPSEETPTEDSTSTGDLSQTTDESTSGSQEPGETAETTSQEPDETEAPEPEPTGDDDGDDGDSGDGDEEGEGDGGSGAEVLSVGAAVLVPLFGYLVL